MGWPRSFRPLDDRARPPDKGLPDGRFLLLREARHLGDAGGGIDWHAAGADRLWRFHLHYWEWMWSIDDPREFEVLWRSWRGATALGDGDVWSPYVVAVRSWALCAAFARFGSDLGVAEDLVKSLAVHRRVISLSLERDLGGNHLIKDLKAVVGLDALLGADVRRATRAFTDELERQVLADGGHEERSPSYHAQVLGDAIDVRDLAADLDVSVAALDATIERMQHWLRTVRLPDGGLPLMNDAWHVSNERLSVLGCGAEAAATFALLPQSGYAVLRSRRLALAIDVGDPCPAHLPAHAHADTLSFELVIDGTRVVVDSGTSSYDDPAIRAIERSTAAHNTISVDCEDSTEVWGTFRAGRRARCHLLHASDREIIAEHDGFRHLPGSPRHRRRVRVEDDVITIEDVVLGTGRHEISSWIHLAPGYDVTGVGPHLRVGDVEIWTSATPHVHPAGEHPLAWAATGFGHRRPAPVIEIAEVGPLPMRLSLTIRAVEPRPDSDERRL